MIALVLQIIELIKRARRVSDVQVMYINVPVFQADGSNVKRLSCSSITQAVIKNFLTFKMPWKWDDNQNKGDEGESGKGVIGCAHADCQRVALM